MACPIVIGPLIEQQVVSTQMPASLKATADQLDFTRAIARSLLSQGRLHRSKKSWDLASNLGSNPCPAPCWFF